jgi:Uma2 family endonuclease
MPRPLPPVRTGLSFEDYLAFEENSSEKHEFVEGQLFLMARATEKHNLRALALVAKLLAVSDPSGCRVLMSDVKSTNTKRPSVLSRCSGCLQR